MSSDLTDVGAGEPTLRADGLRWARLGPDEAVLKRGVVEVRLASPDIAETLDRLLPLADGSRTFDALVGAFPHQRQDDVRALVTALQARHLLTSGGDGREDPESAFWETLAARAPDARKRLAASAVLVVGDGHVGRAVAEALTRCGVGRVPVVSLDAALDGTDADATCVAADSAEWDRLLRVSRAALQARRLLLPVWIEDLVVHVGPLTHPYDTACLRCYRLRTQSNDRHWAAHALLRTAGGADDADGYGAGFLPTMSSVAGQVAATEVVKQLTGLPTSTTGRALELGLVPFRSDLHRVLRVPRCPDCCGTASQGAPVLMHGSQMSE